MVVPAVRFIFGDPPVEIVDENRLVNAVDLRNLGIETVIHLLTNFLVFRMLFER